jgi:DNA repair exonuclease SbcCD nuclease subunit
LKILLINDVHLTDDNRHPKNCTPSYTDDIFDLLYQASELATELGCTAIVQLGDMFHIKSPLSNSHKLIQRTMKWAADTAVPIFIVPGNHDLSHDRLSSLDEGQPLGVLFSSGIVGKAEGYLSVPATEISGVKINEQLPVYGVPWQQFWTAEQSVADRAIKDALKDFEPKDTPQLIVTHAPFFPPGVNPAYEHYPTEKFAQYLHRDNEILRGSNTQVVYGHIHDWHGEYVVKGIRYANYGALSRGSLTESNLTRPIGVTSWDSITGSFEFHALRSRPASEVFRIEQAVEKKEKQIKLDEFLASVGQSSIQVTSTESVMEKIRSLQLGKLFEDTVEKLLTEVG